MSTKGVADIVFCLDASESMQPCFDAVREHITSFIAGLESSPNITWDWRLDFVAHCASDNGVFRAASLYHDCVVDGLYQGQGPTGRFFTSNLDEFRDGLARVNVVGDEAPLMALDCCLDFPWRQIAACHRVVILMTDEPFETGAVLDIQRTRLPGLIEKIMQLHVMLQIVAPDSPGFYELAAVDRSEYEVVDATGDGLARVDFSQALNYMGKSISVGVTNQQAPDMGSVQRGLYCQSDWTATDAPVRGR